LAINLKHKIFKMVISRVPIDERFGWGRINYCGYNGVLIMVE